MSPGELPSTGAQPTGALSQTPWEERKRGREGGRVWKGKGAGGRKEWGIASSNKGGIRGLA